MVETTEPNFAATLGLNWKLFLAQAINFSIVLFVLWRWVFRPVAGALEARRQRIEGSVKKAAEIEERLAKLSAAETAKMKEARVQADQVIREASAAAAEAKAETIAAAKAAADKIMAGTKAAMMAEKEKAMREVRAEIAELTVLAAEKILRAKLDKDEDKKLVSDVIRGIGINS